MSNYSVLENAEREVPPIEILASRSDAYLESKREEAEQRLYNLTSHGKTPSDFRVWNLKKDLEDIRAAQALKRKQGQNAPEPS